MKTIALIPARGGSKGIPNKNIIDFCGKPLLAWSILQAKSSERINQVVVSTDSKEIAGVAQAFGAQIIWRPPETATDTATSESALIHAVKLLNLTDNDLVVFLQATSPLRETSDIDLAISKWQDSGADSLFSGAEIGDFYIWTKKNNELKSANYDYRERGTRQSYEQNFGRQFVENGSIYLFRPQQMVARKNRLGGKIEISEMSFWKSFEVDDNQSLELCRSLFRIQLLKRWETQC